MDGASAEVPISLGPAPISFGPFAAFNGSMTHVGPRGGDSGGGGGGSSCASPRGQSSSTNPWHATFAAVGVLVADDITGGGVIDDLAIPVLLTGALAYDAAQRTFITYTLRHNNKPSLIYSGRASGFGIPDAVMNARLRSHHMVVFGFGQPIVDVSVQGWKYYTAIRGREQQLIDFHGGAYSDGGTSANSIRAVRRNNLLGRVWWEESNMAFGPLAPYTGN
jgi:hypothetical protein